MERAQWYCSLDAPRRRAQKTINGTLTAFRYDGVDVVRESTGGSDATYLRTLSTNELLA
jgi:hypothetical protein